MLKSIIDKNISLQHVYNGKDIRGVNYKNDLILNEYKEYRNESLIFQKSIHYSELWKKRAIYENMDIYISKSLEINNISLNIFQTWHTKDLPPKMKENMELIKSLYNTSSHCFDLWDLHSIIVISLKNKMFCRVCLGLFVSKFICLFVSKFICLFVSKFICLFVIEYYL